MDAQAWIENKSIPDTLLLRIVHSQFVNKTVHFYNGLNQFSSFRGFILFFYPLDFTFVCPTEILAFNEKVDEINNKDAVLIGVSVDSVYSHLAWKNTVLENGGIGNINFPLVSDLSIEISNSYGVLHNGEKALRASFLIDKN